MQDDLNLAEMSTGWPLTYIAEISVGWILPIQTL